MNLGPLGLAILSQETAAAPPGPAAEHISKVEAADEMALEPAVAAAMTTLINYLVSSGIWGGLHSGMLIIGPRTEAGAMVPLKGPAITGTWDSWDRKNGASGGNLDTGLTVDVGAVGDVSLFSYLTSKINDDGNMGGGTLNGAAGSRSLNYRYSDARIQAANQGFTSPNEPGLFGAQRQGEFGMSRFERLGGTSVFTNYSSTASATLDYPCVFNTGADNVAAFYMFGAGVSDAIALRTALQTYVSAISAAIP